MTIIRTSPCDYGGVEVWDSAQPDSPVYLAPHLLTEYWADGSLTTAGEQFVQNTILHRLEEQEIPNGLYAS